jgi:predicted lipoprotein
MLRFREEVSKALSFFTCRSAAACQAYDEILLKQQSSIGTAAKRGSAGDSPRPAGLGALPWLYYETGSSFLTSTDIDLRCDLGPYTLLMHHGI